MDVPCKPDKHGVFLPGLPHVFTEDGKICSPFAEQFHVFHQGKENRADAYSEFLNGCP